MIEYRGQMLIIDAKYYGSSLQTNSQYGNKIVYLGNLYQIYTYVKNKDVNKDKSVSSLLLYANTEENNSDEDYMMMVTKNDKTLDLNKYFNEIQNNQTQYLLNDQALQKSQYTDEKWGKKQCY